MTLEELADFVCGKTGFTDVESVRQCKKFLRARYKMIWDSALWRASLGLLEVQAGLEVPNPEVCLPKEYERIVSARYSGIASGAGLDVNASAMAPVDLTSLFHQDPGWYERTGTPAEYAVSFPVAIPFVARKDQSFAVTAATPTQTSNMAGVVSMFGQKCTIRGADVHGRRIESEITFAFDGNITEFRAAGSTSVTFAYVTQIIKPATPFPVTFQMSGLAESTTELGATETNSVPHVHFRLTRTPALGATLLVLAKRRIYDLVQDTDLTELPNVDNALIAYAQSDMLERARQYGKARAKLEDAGAQMRVLVDLEEHQSAHSSRIIPDMPDAQDWSGLIGV